MLAYGEIGRRETLRHCFGRRRPVRTIAAQLARGVSADVVILSREGLGELIAANRIIAGTDVDLARVPLA